MPRRPSPLHLTREQWVAHMRKEGAAWAAKLITFWRDRGALARESPPFDVDGVIAHVLVILLRDRSLSFERRHDVSRELAPAFCEGAAEVWRAERAK